MLLELIITDVTILRGQICVAGWAPAERRMIRPLQGAGGHHWDPGQGGEHLFWLGNRVRFKALGDRNNRGLPHANEDTLVDGRPQLLARLNGPALAQALQPSESPSVSRLFAVQMAEKRCVDDGSDCPSLGAIRTSVKRLGFGLREQQKGPQLRCWFYDADDERFDLPVASKYLRDLWEGHQYSLNLLERMKLGHRHAHIRIGLAHAFNDGRCYAMVNNILFI
jgi:hypothetical protein